MGNLYRTKNDSQIPSPTLPQPASYIDFAAATPTCSPGPMSTASSSAAPLAVLFLHGQRRPRTLLLLQLHRPTSTPSLSLSISSSLFRRRGRARGRRRHPLDPQGGPKPSPSDRDLELSIDFDAAATRVAAALASLRRSSEAKLRLFLSSGAEAYQDLLTSVQVDRGHRVVFSCRQSSLLFVANLFIWSFVAVLAARVLGWLLSGLGLGFRSGWWSGDRMVVRRDRSLGGREVVVGRRIKGREVGKSSRVSVSPLSPPTGAEVNIGGNALRRPVEKQEKLPKWWPDSISSQVILVAKEEFQREANRLVRAMVDNRMSGKDYKDDDIIQLRKICKISGAKVSFETDYARDSFYRASVDFVLRTCSRVKVPFNGVQIDGEEARQFISGLADNIGLQNIRAATLVRAAVAAHTRSCFLQCWALEVQGKRSESLEELSKICRIYQIFPPEEHSPEMEMVASGLKRNLQVEQREHLLTMYREACGVESQNIAAEALGLGFGGHPTVKSKDTRAS
ncbi:uncharacterized protein [Elaeis guineensis]|uniref:Uncharacterized protein LOC105051425 n=1 Tax=Elaeis guineensis var. tenera TaxID=51953 RepID=A0A6I9RY18_ELAGV|nr:uncharacterized protein LOC105051425 [Elaeis guineensis]